MSLIQSSCLLDGGLMKMLTGKMVGNALTNLFNYEMQGVTREGLYCH